VVLVDCVDADTIGNHAQCDTFHAVDIYCACNEFGESRQSLLGTRSARGPQSEAFDFRLRPAIQGRETVDEGLMLQKLLQIVAREAGSVAQSDLRCACGCFRSEPGVNDNPHRFPGSFSSPRRQAFRNDAIVSAGQLRWVETLMLFATPTIASSKRI